MKQKTIHRQLSGFTLVEMLVVISIIAVLAGLLFPVGAAIKRNATIKRAKAELEQLETAIDAYKQKLGFYPPSNPLPDPANPAGDPKQGWPTANPLYFELLGTVANGSDFETIDGSAKITATQIKTIFGRDAFSNLGSRKGAEEGFMAEKFLRGTIKSSQIGELAPGVKILISGTSWPESAAWKPILNTTLNPWRYVSTNPTNNTKTYDLWVDLPIGKRIYRVSNWRREADVVTVP